MSIWHLLKRSALPLLAAIVAMGLYVHRVGTALWRPYLYAEDGKVFLQEQLLLGTDALLTPFAGYVHAVPRLTALIASPFSAVWAPTIYAWINLGVMVWVVLTIAFCRLPYAWVLALLLFTVPHTGEVFGTITNAQWIMACALPLIAMTATPASFANRVNQRVFIALAGLSGPFSLFALPLFAWRVFERRDRHAIWLAALGATAALVQIISVANNYVSFAGDREPMHLALTILDRWAGNLAYGWRSDTWYALLLTFCYGAIVLALAWWSTQRRLNMALLFFIALILVSIWLKFMPGHSRHLDFPTVDDRYFYVPKVLTLWILAGALYASAHWKKIVGMLALVLSIGAVENGGLEWWRKYIYPHKPWTEQARNIDAGYAVDIPINPEPYSVQLPARPGRNTGS